MMTLQEIINSIESLPTEDESIYLSFFASNELRIDGLKFWLMLRK